ncbi:MAG: serine hydrolase [Burkholderiaceae bacterium]
MRLSPRAFGLAAISLLLMLGAAIAFAWHKQYPDSLSGLAAKTACGGVFIARRPLSAVVEQDLQTLSVAMRLITLTIDDRDQLAKATLPITGSRFAVYSPDRGCVLLPPGDVPEARALGPEPMVPTAHRPMRLAAADRATERPPLPWPQGSATAAPAQWPAAIDQAALGQAVDKVFAGPHASSVSPSASAARGPGTRAVLVVHEGRLLVERLADGFDSQTPQLGWSMAKTVLGVLAWMRFQELGIHFDSPVVAQMKRVPQPVWAGEWLRDGRAAITIDNLFTMHDGLDHASDSFSMLSDLPQMLWDTDNTASYAGNRTLAHPPGTYWRYASAVSLLLSRVLRDQFASDASYLRYPGEALFAPIGAQSATFETDGDGTFIASSYLWATPQDWARIGWLMLQDGRWGERQVFPKGWLDYARAHRTDSSGEVGPYGAQVWLTHDTKALNCPGSARLPPDGLMLTGAWGQVMGIFPSRQAVILRLGWTTDDASFNRCQWMSDILAALP